MMPVTQTICITLNPDCLLTIFDNLTSRLPNRYTPNKHRPLNALRSASQVCRQWRDLIVASPSLWGRVVDFGFEMYGPRRRWWMEEVVRRAGDKAPLWITGDLVECRPGNPGAGLMFDAQAFFIRLLVLDAWERIEQLSVTIHPNRVPECILYSFASRAPILTVFDVRFDGFGELLLVPTSASSSGSSASQIKSRILFSDYAPSLVSINPDRVAFSTDAPWLAHIRSIEIPFWMSLKDILDVLRNSPSLDHFSLDRTIHRRMETDIEVIPLPSRYAARQGPNLSYIHICGTSLAPTAAILSYVSPGVTLRSFEITIDNRYPDTQDREAVPLLRQALPLYIARYFNTGGGGGGSSNSNSALASSSPDTDVSLEISPGNFKFHNTLDTITTYTDPSPSSGSGLDSDADSDSYYEVPGSQARGSFEMRIEYPFRNSNICGDPLTTSLLDAFAEASQLDTGNERDQRPFKSTTRLKLCFTGLYNRQTSLTLYPHLDAMLASFEHVHTLFLNELSSHILWNTVKIWRGRTLPKDHHSQRCTGGNSNHVVLFPKLHTLYLDTLPSYYKGSKSHLRRRRHQKGIGLKRFLLERKRIGFPVSRLDLTRCARSHYAQDLRSLEKVGGLEVVWMKKKKRVGVGVGVGRESEAGEDDDDDDSENVCRYVCGSGDPERLKGIF